MTTSSARLLSFIQKNGVVNQPINLFQPLINFLSNFDTYNASHNISQVNKKRDTIYDVKLVVSIIDEIYQEEPFIDISDLIDIINTDFDFYVSDFGQAFGYESNSIIQKHTGISLNKIKTQDHLVAVLCYKDLTGYITFDPHILVIKYFLSIQMQDQSIFKFQNKRKLTWCDFQSECYQRMHIKTIKEVNKFYEKLWIVVYNCV
jgi:hypothetical protein